MLVQANGSAVSFTEGSGDSFVAPGLLNASFNGDVVKPTLKVSASGQVTLITAGGAGKVTIQLATSNTHTGWAKTRPETVKLRGHSRIRRHTPELKRPKRNARRKRGHTR
jgi:hypothetical protein